MAQIIPLSGVVNGYKYEFVQQTLGCTTYIVSSIDTNEKIMVNCYTPMDIFKVTHSPEQIWNQREQ